MQLVRDLLPLGASPSLIDSALLIEPLVLETFSLTPSLLLAPSLLESFALEWLFLVAWFVASLLVELRQRILDRWRLVGVTVLRLRATERHTGRLEPWRIAVRRESTGWLGREAADRSDRGQVGRHPTQHRLAGGIPRVGE